MTSLNAPTKSILSNVEIKEFNLNESEEILLRRCVVIYSECYFKG